MAHQNSDPPLTRAAHMTGGLNSENQTSNDLRDFSKCVAVLRSILYQDRSLDKVEFLFMEKQMQVLQIAYLRWKRKHVWRTDFH
jgi:hypothetical protein